VAIDQLEQVVRALERISKILAGMLLRDVEEADQKVKIKRLKQCGFDNTEIAQMLGTTRNTVGVAVHSLKKTGKGKRRTARKKAKQD
jgi:DNA-binding NarL/FixJ family response regulator